MNPTPSRSPNLRTLALLSLGTVVTGLSMTTAQGAAAAEIGSGYHSASLSPRGALSASWHHSGREHVKWHSHRWAADDEDRGPQGPRGQRGPRGPEGEVGPMGPQGFQGDTGAQGPQGFQGDIGAQGPQGFQGDIGAQGPQGFQGDIGAQGPQGFQGDIGAQGPQGFQGDTGPQGPQGFQGPGGLATVVNTAAATVGVPATPTATTTVAAVVGPTLTATAFCGAGKYALGGGYSTTGFPTLVTMDAPVGGSPATGWQVGENISGPSTLTTYVVCSS